MPQRPLHEISPAGLRESWAIAGIESIFRMHATIYFGLALLLAIVLGFVVDFGMMPASRWLARLALQRAIAAILLLPVIGFAGGLLAAAAYAVFSRSGGPHSPGYGIAFGLLLFCGTALGIALAVLLSVGLRWPRVMAGGVILGSAGAWWLAGAESYSSAHRLFSATIIAIGSSLIIWAGERRNKSRRGGDSDGQ